MSSHSVSLSKARQRISMLVPTICLSIIALTISVEAQTFSSGSTGADGPFSPTTSQTVQLPDSGIFNFTTVNIPSGVTITFTRNAKNTPVTILTTGDVAINGGIRLDGAAGSLHTNGVGGPGGFNGGTGGLGVAGLFLGIGGDGPGGGGGAGNSTGDPGGGGGGGFASGGTDGVGPSKGSGGPSYGAIALLPLIGGSGGGGGGGRDGNNHGGSGGGGGGAILIASSGAITFADALILSRGGPGAPPFGGASVGGGGGGGAGGAIRIVANTVRGTVSFDVSGGSPGAVFGNDAGGNGANGFMRIEAFDSGQLSPRFTPTTSLTVSVTQPNPAILQNTPTLRITSVAGIASPAIPKGSLSNTPDISLPVNQSNPVTVAIQAANIPVNTAVTVSVIPDNGTRSSVVAGTLSGTQASSTATANVTLPTTGTTLIIASTTIDLTLAQAKPLIIKGERIDFIEVTATFGGKSDIVYVTHSGRRIRSGE